LEEEMPVRDESENRIYYAQRAREERQRAVICEDNSAALAHLRMAEEYDRRAQIVGMANSSAASA
jgi:hypothetical protein